MEKKFIRLNINDNYLSFGNLFRLIKEKSSNNKTFTQSDIFSAIFETYDIADSTVNNYCTGLRAINSQYKEFIQNKYDKYESNKNIFIDNIRSIIEILESSTIDKITIKQINENNKLKHVCNKLYTISKNDSDVDMVLSNELNKHLNNNDYYSFIIRVIYYVVCEKNQPIYINDEINNVIEKNIYNTNISVKEIQDFIKIQLNSAIWSIRGIKELAKQGNPFACFEMASMEFYGIVVGYPRYEEAYNYYKIAAENNHPVANWAIGYLYYEGYIGNKSKHDLYLALKFFNKSKRLNCSNAYNSLRINFTK